MFISNTTDESPASLPAAPIAAPAPGAGAPPPPIHNGQAYWFKVVARNDGSFSVTNARNNFGKSYLRIEDGRKKDDGRNLLAP